MGIKRTLLPPFFSSDRRKSCSNILDQGEEQKERRGPNWTLRCVRESVAWHRFKICLCPLVRKARRKKERKARKKKIHNNKKLDGFDNKTKRAGTGNRFCNWTLFHSMAESTVWNIENATKFGRDRKPYIAFYFAFVSLSLSFFVSLSHYVIFK